MHNKVYKLNLLKILKIKNIKQIIDKNSKYKKLF